MKKIATGFLLLFLLGSSSCKTSIIPPDGKKDPRRYTWTKTVLGDGTYQILPRDIWGSSANDVYVVGHASNLFIGKIWHFNGSQWSDITTKYVESYNAAFPGRQVFNWTPEAVWGFAQSDVWIVGSRDTSTVSQQIKEGFVMRFNGQVWREIPIDSANTLSTIWGTSPVDMWAAGHLGRFYHFDGVSWLNYAVADTIFVGFFAGRVNSKVYATGANLGMDGRLYLSLCEWSGSNWSVSEVSTEPSLSFRVVDLIEGNLYSAIPAKVQKRLSENFWTQVFFDPSADFLRIKGLSESNVLVVGGPGETIFHFNGQNWMRLSQFSDPNILYSNLFVFDSGVVVIGRDVAATRGYVVYGR